ncbi:ubiquinone biosynthesis protein UbiA [Fulvivirga sp. RKSG066]|uniref:UbiA family prenyltransferase n=1 Tax=Fulvivirga aurantia TaxID=2529383 RepID=UPI0012BD2EC5|nr:UbiA family prenyltransferase [Fulvivirga aurantia]MTI20423.1 ubiquinone biosynthesis protein UbiA [Fulvivirga aurantia]
MFKKSTWLHLRIPFSYFLLPVFLFALAVSVNIDPTRLFIVFVALHIFLYPASNGFNSYFDKDTESIGGLKKPPKVTKGLYYMSLVFDVIAIGLGLLISYDFAIMLFVYGLVSKAYSHPIFRLKKYPYTSWLIAGLFQGWFTFLMAYVGLNGFSIDLALQPTILIPGLLSSAILWGSYPMTQIYQHKEDKKRGDVTLSYKLGIRGTFHFTAIVFAIASMGYYFYFANYHSAEYGTHFFIALAPVIGFFTYWYFLVRKNQEKANYTFTMWLNAISATCLNAFFIYFFLDSTQLIQAIQGGF